MDRLRERLRLRRSLPAGENLRAARIAAGLTMQDVAEALGVHVTSVLRWERGKRKPRGANAERYAVLLQDLG